MSDTKTTLPRLYQLTLTEDELAAITTSVGIGASLVMHDPTDTIATTAHLLRAILYRLKVEGYNDLVDKLNSIMVTTNYKPLDPAHITIIKID